MSKKFRGTISPWKFVPYGTEKFVAGTHQAQEDEERTNQGFWGSRVGPIRTSLIVREYEEGGKRYVETLNSVYELVGEEYGLE